MLFAELSTEHVSTLGVVAISLIGTLTYLAKSAFPKLLQNYRDDIKQLNEECRGERRELAETHSKDMAARDDCIKRLTEAIDRIVTRLDHIESKLSK